MMQGKAEDKKNLPGGAPINFETVCFSPYSLISILVIAFSLLNKDSASALQSSVLPTPERERFYEYQY